MTSVGRRYDGQKGVGKITTTSTKTAKIATISKSAASSRTIQFNIEIRGVFFFFFIDHYGHERIDRSIR